MHPYIITLVFALVGANLAVATALSSRKDATELQKVSDAGIPLPEMAKNVIYLYQTSIAMSVFSFMLLFVFFLAPEYNISKNLLGMLKSSLCLFVLVTSLMVLIVGVKLSNSSSMEYVKLGIAASVFNILSVGSSVIYIYKMLMK